jgi:hypothetical protein
VEIQKVVFSSWLKLVDCTKGCYSNAKIDHVIHTSYVYIKLNPTHILCSLDTCAVSFTQSTINSKLLEHTCSPWSGALVHACMVFFSLFYIFVEVDKCCEFFMVFSFVRNVWIDKLILVLYIYKLFLFSILKRWFHLTIIFSTF